METLTIIFIAFIATISFAQEFPRIELEDASLLHLKDLDVKVEIVGNKAETTYSMKYFNDTDRVLEGELIFPLSQGQSVSNFAIDLNGQLRNAVIVEKEKARVAYESTVRKTIDPGLLTLTKGNNYKARVYPIPAHGYKLLEITFEEELKSRNTNLLYSLPFDFKDSLNFSLEMKLFNSDLKPIVKSGQYNLKFKEANHTLIANFKSENFKPSDQVQIEIPTNQTAEITAYSDYFNFSKMFKQKSKVKTKPKTLTLLWDASYSMRNKVLDAEFQLLNKYIKYLKNVEIDLIVFSNTIDSRRTFNITNGNWKTIRKYLENTIYDGGTSLVNFKDIKSDEAILFSDGMINLGDLNCQFTGNLFTVNTSNVANHQYLNQISELYNGQYINLKVKTIEQALSQLKHLPYRFLGYSNNSNISEVYPKSGVPIIENFSVSGKFQDSTKLELLFGFGSQVEERITIDLKKVNSSKLVKRFWAKRKLEHLNKNKETNRNEIIQLGIKYGLVTDYTAMIVLDRLEDYVRYEIEPPLELKAAYKERMEDIIRQRKIKQENIARIKKDLKEDLIALKKWYDTDFPIKRSEKQPKQVAEVIQNSTVLDTISEIASSNRTLPIEIESEIEDVENQIEIKTVRNNTINQVVNDEIFKYQIRGVIVDESGMPLPGVNIWQEGTDNGTQTNFDGEYVFNFNERGVLVFSYVGYKTITQNIEGSKTIDVVLEEDTTMLEEVVVTAQGIKSEQKALGYAVSVVQSEELEQYPQGDIVRVLSGKASGVQIEKSESKNIVIRGAASTNKNSKPLYVIDGEVSNENTYHTISSDEIRTITVLNEDISKVLYGSSGASQVIVVETKSGRDRNQEKIEELSSRISNEIKLKEWSPDNDYIKILSSQSDNVLAYEKYLKIRNNYRNMPSFYLDVSDFFESRGDKKTALKIISNLAEVDLDNHEILRALIYKLEYFNQYESALYLCKELLRLRPEEVQSTRDLALAYENVGDYQKAFDLLTSIINGNLVEKDLENRFYGIEQIALVEAGHILNKHRNKLELTKEQKEIIFPLEIDLRVVVDWNHNNTDLDLWVDNPMQESISYKKNYSDFGDRLSEDMTEGYGPEEYLTKKGVKGTYSIEIDYYADEVQKISGPTILKITIFKNYGKSNEIKEVRVVRLDKEEDRIDIGEIEFK